MPGWARRTPWHRFGDFHHPPRTRMGAASECLPDRQAMKMELRDTEFLVLWHQQTLSWMSYPAFSPE